MTFKRDLGLVFPPYSASRAPSRLPSISASCYYVIFRYPEPPFPPGSGLRLVCRFLPSFSAASFSSSNHLSLLSLIFKITFFYVCHLGLFPSFFCFVFLSACVSCSFIPSFPYLPLPCFIFLALLFALRASLSIYKETPGWLFLVFGLLAYVALFYFNSIYHFSMLSRLAVCQSPFYHLLPFGVFKHVFNLFFALSYVNSIYLFMLSRLFVCPPPLLLYHLLPFGVFKHIFTVFSRLFLCLPVSSVTNMLSRYAAVFLATASCST